jgi:hypothetical protein
MTQLLRQLHTTKLKPLGNNKSANVVHQKMTLTNAPTNIKIPTTHHQNTPQAPQEVAPEVTLPIVQVTPEAHQTPNKKINDTDTLGTLTLNMLTTTSKKRNIATIQNLIIQKVEEEAPPLNMKIKN